MIPVATVEAEVMNTLGGEKIEMTFDEKALRHLMQVLTKLYGDEQLACIREYSTNARDAHIEIGREDRPIEVTTPTTLDPYLRIVDHGVGLSVDDIRKMYSKYGGSTKREVEDQNGSLGLGAKSALAYTNQFSLISIKNGRKIHVSVSRNSAGGGEMEIIDESATDEESGTTIVIPAQRMNSFAHKAAKFFRYWEKGTVLLNGTDPSKRDELKKVTDRIYVDEDSYEDSDIVFMGNVPYPVTTKIGRLRRANSNIVAFVSMDGADQVIFTPNREGLIYEGQTEKVLKSLSDEYDGYVVSDIQSEIDQCATRAEAFTKYRGIYGEFFGWEPQDKITYKGEDMPQINDVIREVIPPMMPSDKFYVWWPNRSRRTVQLDWSVRWNNIRWVVYNYPSGEPSNDHRRKTRMYVEENKAGTPMGNTVYVKHDKKYIEHSVWYDNKFLDWNEIKKIRIQRTPSAGASEEWNVMTAPYGYVSPRDDIKPKQQIIYWSSARDQDISMDKFKVLTKHYPKAILVREPMNRHKRLVRLFPKARHLHTVLAELQKNLQSKVKGTDFDYQDIGRLVNGHLAQTLVDTTKITGKKIKDPDFIRLATAYAGRGSMKTSDAYDELRILGCTPLPPAGYAPVDELYYIRNNYPLLGFVQTYGLDSDVKADLIDYVNNKYKERKGL